MLKDVGMTVPKINKTSYSLFSNDDTHMSVETLEFWTRVIIYPATEQRNNVGLLSVYMYTYQHSASYYFPTSLDLRVMLSIYHLLICINTYIFISLM